MMTILMSIDDRDADDDEEQYDFCQSRYRDDYDAAYEEDEGKRKRAKK